MSDDRREALFKEYGEVSSTFRLLTDIRFKLLAFLPIATAAAAALKGDSLSIQSLVLSLFGFVITIGLITYNARNDQLYDELVGRAASIERSLGLPDGAFAQRPRPWLTIRFLKRSWKVDHRTGISAIYAASIALWLFGVLAPLLEFARRLYVDAGFAHFGVSNPALYVQIFALVLTGLTICLATGSIRTQRKIRQDEMRKLAAAAATRVLTIGLSNLPNDDEAIALCAKLAGEADAKMRARAFFYAALSSESLSNYLLPGSDLQEAAQMVALLTDLPGRWIFDCATNRRGEVAPASPDISVEQPA